MNPLNTWRLPLRLARRDALRHKARSALVLVMIALPVLAVTAADVLAQTSQVSGAESLDRRIGASEALVTVTDGVDEVLQGPDPEVQYPQLNGDGEVAAPTGDQVSSLLDGATLVDLRQAQVQVATDKGQTSVEAVETDLQQPVTERLYDLTSGRLPRAAGEVVVNQATLDKGYAVGDTLTLVADEAPAAPTIVGVAESAVARNYPVAFGPVGTLGAQTPGTTQWLVDGGPVSWATVQQLNQIGALVTSRAVIEDPPPSSDWPQEVRPTPSSDGTLPVLALIVIMVLIEVVLLAGPAFAVSARKQQRSLALLSATGGTPQQSRRVIVAGALVLGTVAAALGVGLGLGVARLLEPFVQARSDMWFGPFEVPWLHLVGVAAFGVVSAFLAAVVPAYLASRQDVVAVLAGRRGDQAPSLKSPVLGLVLLGVGIGGSALGATRPGGELLIAGSAIPAVLGMVLLVPVVLAGLAKVSGRLPLVLRYAVRDANRHRTRTVPAVSAVAATVAGVVALGIGLTSDEAENEGTYVASMPRGVSVVSGVDPAEDQWPALRSVVERELPAATVTELKGISDYQSWTEVSLGDEPLLSSSGGPLGAQVMVDDDSLPLGLIGISAADRERATAALAAGRAVVFANSPHDDAEVQLATQEYDPDTGENEATHQTRAEATFVAVGEGDRWSGPAAVVPTPVVEALGVPASTVSLAVTGTSITERQEEAVNEGVAAISEYSYLYVERGYQADDETVIAQLILVLLGGVLMLGGTLTATFLALSDARPDLATLSAIGASPRMRRGVAAAYAVVVGVVGAALGAAVGFIPGIAVTWPLTSNPGTTCFIEGGGTCTADGGGGTGPFLDVPWLMVLGLVVVLPAVTSLIVGLAARSRLPLVARLD